MPHLRRFVGDCVQLVSFQFSHDGGQFTIDAATCGAEGIDYPWGKHVPADKATAWHVDLPRRRLGGKHDWLVFGPRTWEPGSGEARPSAHYDAIAEEAVARVIDEGIPYLEAGCTERWAGETL